MYVCIYQISFKSKKLFVDGRTYGHPQPPILLGRLLEVDLKTNNPGNWHIASADFYDTN